MKNSVIRESLSGFFAGLIGTGGVLRVAFLSSFNIDKSVYIATIAAISLAVDFTRIQVYLLSGYLTSDFYNLVPLLFLTAISGSFIGKQVVNKIPSNHSENLLWCLLRFLV